MQVLEITKGKSARHWWHFDVDTESLPGNFQVWLDRVEWSLQSVAGDADHICRAPMDRVIRLALSDSLAWTTKHDQDAQYRPLLGKGILRVSVFAGDREEAIEIFADVMSQVVTMTAREVESRTFWKCYLATDLYEYVEKVYLPSVEPLEIWYKGEGL